MVMNGNVWKSGNGFSNKKPFPEHNRKGQKAKKPKTKNHQNFRRQWMIMDILAYPSRLLYRFYRINLHPILLACHEL